MKEIKSFLNNNLISFKLSITDFIYQEIYRLAVYKQAHIEIKKIQKIYSQLKINLTKFEDIYEYKHIVELGCLATDLIVLGFDEVQFQKEIKQCIVNPYYANSEFPWTHDNSGTPEDIDKRRAIYKDTLSIISNVYTKYSKMGWTIPTLYPPHLFALEQDYESTLEYIVNKKYLSKIETVYEDDLFSDDKENPKKIRTTKISPPYEPYDVINPYRLNIVNYDYTFDEVPIPKKSLGRKLHSKKFKNAELTEDQFLKLIELKFVNTENNPHICQSLSVNIDLSSELNERDLLQTLTSISNEICSVQNNNRLGKMVLATNFDELNKAASLTKLETLGFMQLMEIFSFKSQNEFELNELKLIICGLIVYEKRWLKNQNKLGVLEISTNLSAKLKDEYGLGFSEKNIDRGYISVNKLVKKQLDELNKVPE